MKLFVRTSQNTGVEVGFVGSLFLGGAWVFGLILEALVMLAVGVGRLCLWAFDLTKPRPITTERNDHDREERP